MLSKTNEFNLNILLVSCFILHNKIKYPGSKSRFKIRLNRLADSAKTSLEDIEYTLLFLLRQGIVYTENGYLYINLKLVKKLLKKEFKLKTETRTFIVQTNFEVIVKPEILIKNLFFLIQFCEFKKKDVIYRFRITPNSLHNGFILKWTPDRIMRFISENSENPIPENVGFLIDEIYNRTGELSIGMAGSFITGKKFAIQQIKEDNDIKKLILKEISPALVLIDNRVSIDELFFLLKEKNFYPSIEKEKILAAKDNFILHLSLEEIENFYSAIIALKEIGFEHKLSVNYNLLNNLLEKMEKLLHKKSLIKSRAVDKAIKYQQELKNSIKKYILKTIESSIQVPKVLISNRISEQYKGENPAVKLKEMKKMIEYAIKNKILLIIRVYSPSSRTKYSDYLIEPRYLYKNSLYAYVKELKEEQSFDLKKISFIMLPGS